MVIMKKLRYLHAHSRRFYIGICTVIFALILLVLPSSYVVEQPGPTENVLDNNIITITGVPEHKSHGKLLLTTVNASGVPGYPVTNAQVLFGWVSSRMLVMPQEAVFPVGQSAEEYEEESTQEMDTSQEDATAAALAYAKKMGIDTDGAHVKMHVEDIGGPSAGMMYALGVLDLLTKTDETNGLTIAGTGTMDKNGDVGAIGGIDLKMIGARDSGATWFLAPKDNCAEVVGHVPQGLRDVQVSTLDEAYKALVAIGSGKGESLPHCEVK